MSGARAAFGVAISGKSVNKLIGNFPDVAGAHGDNQVAGPATLPDVGDDVFEVGEIDRVAAVGTDALDQVGLQTASRSAALSRTK